MKILWMVALLYGHCALAGDWPQWGGSEGRNMVSAERGLPTSFDPGQKDPATGEVVLSTTTNVKWAVKLGTDCYSTPVVAGGRVFIGTNDQPVGSDPRFVRTGGGMIRCFDEGTGRLLWQLVTPARKRLPPGAHFIHQRLGICSSAAVDGDRVYIVSSAGEVLCLDVHGQAGGNRGPFVDEATYMAGEGNRPVELRPTDGDILWRFDPVDQLGVLPHDAASCSILVHGDVIYLSTSNGMDGSHRQMPAPEAPAFIALDKRTGKLVATEDEHLSRRLFHAQWSSPSLGRVGDRALVFVGGGDGVCYAFEALDSVPELPVKLKKVWSYDCNPPQFRLRDGQPIAYLEGDQLLTRGPNAGDGRYLGPCDVIATPVFLNNRVYVAIGRDPTDGRGRGMLHCIDATKTGDITESGRVWTCDGLDRSISTAAIADGLVYISDIAGRMHCLDATTGKAAWTYDLHTETWGSALAADGRLYFGNQNELLIMAQGRAPNLLARVRLGAPIYTTPVAANGVLFIASQRCLWAVKGSQ